MARHTLRAVAISSQPRWSVVSPDLCCGPISGASDARKAATTSCTCFAAITLFLGARKPSNRRENGTNSFVESTRRCSGVVGPCASECVETQRGPLPRVVLEHGRLPCARCCDDLTQLARLQFGASDREPLVIPYDAVGRDRYGRSGDGRSRRCGWSGNGWATQLDAHQSVIVYAEVV
eukprot:5687299-Prymnesium_polylepis.2